MKHFIIFILGFALFVGMSAWAKPPSSKPNFQRLAEELQLSDQQQDAFVAVMEEQHLKRRNIHRENREAVHARMSGLQKQLIAKLEPILTTDQLTQFKERQEDRRKARMRHRPLGAHSGCCHQGDMNAR